ncbi:hypothetical protein RB620_19300 [Paenibacillus sp. LHD-117]|uniref:glycan biosynthesis hexose transferase WsfD n=1 Tax=Paenibacillus sp. LHD-117 TaxID=3071412 RepID=UPI0027DFBF82|nr:hypothetical protein [Paenibacillus sp. LHD-117]MDQ6421577.1 hypothetical protein [Paenibacillus sp. LHD-117]
MTGINRIYEGGAAAFSRHLSPSLLAAVSVGMIASFALFVPPYVGMADNGDFFRIIYGNGLYFNAPDYDGQYFGYFVKEYGILRYFNENGDALFSSQSLFIRLALLLNKILYSPERFDIRIQAAVYVLLHMAAVYLLVEGVTWRTPRKLGYPIALLAVFIFGDTGYTAYFNSFYGESVILIMALTIAASGLLLVRKRYNDYTMLAMFAISALLLTTSKQQNAPVGVMAAVMGLILVYVRKNKSYRAFAAFACAILLLSGIATYALIPRQFVTINQYHAMTRGALLLSENPEATLRAFGIDEQYAILTGSIYYEQYTTIDTDSPLLFEPFYDRYGFVSLLAYYMTHPDQGIEMIHLAARHAFDIHPQAMGNFERSAGMAFGQHTAFFTGYSTMKAALAPKTFGFIALWMLIVTGLYLPSFVSSARAKRLRGAIKLPMIVGLMFIGLSGIVVSIVGAGDADLAKHEFLFTVVFDIVTFVAVSDAIQGRHWRAERLAGREAIG